MGEYGVIKISRLFLIGLFSWLAGKDSNSKSLNEFVFRLDRQWTVEVAALEHLKNSHRLIMGKTMSSHFLCCL